MRYCSFYIMLCFYNVGETQYIASNEEKCRRQKPSTAFKAKSPPQLLT